MRRATENVTTDLFECPTPAPLVDGSQDWRAEISHIVGSMLSLAAMDGKDRHTIAAHMSRLSGCEVSKAMLDGYSADSRDAFNISLHRVVLLEAACESHALTAWLVGKRGGKLLIGAEAINAEIGRLQRISDDAARRARELKAQARFTA